MSQQLKRMMNQRMMNRRLKRIMDLRLKTTMSWVLCFLICSSYCLPVFALPEDNHKPLHINANASQFNYKTGFNVYEGNVTVNQGTTHLLAEKVTTQSNQKHKIQEAYAYGTFQKPAIFITKPKTGDKDVRAEAEVIKFLPIQNLIVLEGNVKISQGENSFHGPCIIYNMQDQVVSAPANDKGRATIVITPDKNGFGKNELLVRNDSKLALRSDKMAIKIKT